MSTGSLPPISHRYPAMPACLLACSPALFAITGFERDAIAADASATAGTPTVGLAMTADEEIRPDLFNRKLRAAFRTLAPFDVTPLAYQPNQEQHHE